MRHKKQRYDEMTDKDLKLKSILGNPANYNTISEVLEDYEVEVTSEAIDGFLAAVYYFCELPDHKEPGVCYRSSMDKYPVRLKVASGERPTFGNYTKLEVANAVSSALQKLIDGRPQEQDDETVNAEESSEPKTPNKMRYVLDEEKGVWVDKETGKPVPIVF